MKRLVLLTLILVMLCSMGTASAAEISDIHGFTDGEEYQRILLGEYPYEEDGTPAAVKWWILFKDEENYALLISENILDVAQVMYCDRPVEGNRKFERITQYNESDLFKWMNGDMLDTLGAGTDLRPYLKDTENGKLFPLTTAEFMEEKYGFPHSKRGTMEDDPPLPAAKIRMAKGTPYAKNHVLFEKYKSKLNVQKDHSPYWAVKMKAPGDKNCVHLQIVGYDGHLSWGVYSRVNIGVRPSLWLDLNQIEITGGDGSDGNPWQIALKPVTE